MVWYDMVKYEGSVHILSRVTKYVSGYKKVSKRQVINFRITYGMV